MRTCTYILELWRKKQLDGTRLMMQSLIYGESRQIPSSIRVIHTTRPDKFRPLGDIPNQVVTGQIRLFHNSLLNSSIFQRFGVSSSTSPQNNENGTVKSGDGLGNTVESNDARAKTSADPDKKADSDSDSEGDLSMDDLVKLLGEKEELLKMKHKEMETMQDKVLRNLAETENIMERTKREAEHSKKFAIQTFAKSLLDFADNLGRASSVVKDKFEKIDTSEDPAGALPLLKTLLEGVEMTEKQLAEVFKKFGVEKYDPVNEQFDPHRHNAVFQVQDPSKPSNTVAVVLKPGYMLYERIIRPAEVGVTVAGDN